MNNSKKEIEDAVMAAAKLIRDSGSVPNELICSREDFICLMLKLNTPIEQINSMLAANELEPLTQEEIKKGTSCL